MLEIQKRVKGFSFAVSIMLYITALALAPCGVLENKKFLLLCSREHKRKNWLFSGSPKGASASATVYSIIESAKANSINPYKYLQFIFSQLPGVQFGQHPEFLEDYPPVESRGSRSLSIEQNSAYPNLFAFSIHRVI